MTWLDENKTKNEVQTAKAGWLGDIMFQFQPCLRHTTGFRNWLRGLVYLKVVQRRIPQKINFLYWFLASCICSYSNYNGFSKTVVETPLKYCLSLSEIPLTFTCVLSRNCSYGRMTRIVGIIADIPVSGKIVYHSQERLSVRRIWNLQICQ